MSSILFNTNGNDITIFYWRNRKIELQKVLNLREKGGFNYDRYL